MRINGNRPSKNTIWTYASASSSVKSEASYHWTMRPLRSLRLKIIAMKYISLPFTLFEDTFEKKPFRIIFVFINSYELTGFLLRCSRWSSSRRSLSVKYSMARISSLYASDIPVSCSCSLFSVFCCRRCLRCCKRCSLCSAVSCWRLLSFVVHAEFQVGVLTLEEFRWKIFLGEELQPLVVLAIQRHLYGRLLVIHRS